MVATTDYFEVYSVGLCYLSVCTDIKDNDIIELKANAMYPTGIRSRWHMASRMFNDGSPNPHPCEQDSSHTHYLLEC